MHPFVLLILPLTTLALPGKSPPEKPVFKLISLQTYKDSTCSASVSEDIPNFVTRCQTSPDVFTNFQLHETDLTDVEIKTSKSIKFSNIPCTYKFWENDKCSGDPVFSKTEDKVEPLKCIGIEGGTKARSWRIDCPDMPKEREE